MSGIDVSAEIEIDAAPADIAGVMFDPTREPEWMPMVTGVELVDPALQTGARVKRTGAVMGRTFEWTTEVEAVHFPHALTVRVVEGPFSGTVRYEIQRSGTGSRVRIRNAGDSPLLGGFPAALVSGPMRNAMTAALERLKGLVETARVH